MSSPNAEPGARSDDQQSDPTVWFVEAGDLFAEAYCVTLVRDVAVDAVFARLKARLSQRGEVDFDTLVEEAYEQAQEDDRYQLAGAAERSGWTLVVEPNGFVGTRRKRKRAVSYGTTAITCYANVNYVNEFSVTVDGAEVLSFDRMWPGERSGTDVDRYTDDMVAAGFSLAEDAAADVEDDGDALQDDVACVVLIERLTGLRLTVGLLSSLAWRTALLKNP